MPSKASLILCALAMALPHAAPADDRRPLQVDDLFAIRDVGGPQISPDGGSVVFTVRSLDPMKDKVDTDIYRVPMAGGEAVRLTTSPKPDTRPRFSPDGRQIAFLSGREGKKTQVFLLPAAGGEAVKLTDYKGGVSDLAWSPDGTRLALVVNDPDPDEKPEDDAKADGDAKKTPKPIVLQPAPVQARRGGLPPRPSRPRPCLRRRGEDHGPGRRAGPTTTRTPCGRPTGRRSRSSATAPPSPTPTATPTSSSWPRARTPRPRLTTAPTEAKTPSFSPDGKLIAYVEGGDPADMWYAADHVAVVPVAGGESRPLTKSLDQNPLATPRFSADGSSLLFLVEDRGNVHLARVPVAGGAVEQVVTGDRVLSSFELGAEGRDGRPGEPARSSEGDLSGHALGPAAPDPRERRRAQGRSSSPR